MTQNRKRLNALEILGLAANSIAQMEDSAAPCLGHQEEWKSAIEQVSACLWALSKLVVRNKKVLVRVDPDIEAFGW